jgi:ferredoxin-fold anticodon binding domain-containing protein
MSSDTPATTDESNNNLTLDDFKRPGMMFEVGDIQFLTAGGAGDLGPKVIRLHNINHARLGHEELMSEVLRKDIEANDVSVLSTHDADTEVGINRTVLATLVDYIAFDVQDYGDTIPKDVRDAVAIGQEILD